MKIELPENLAEELADIAGVHGFTDHSTCDPSDLKTCCRVCFIPALADRIRKAAENEDIRLMVERSRRYGLRKA